MRSSGWSSLSLVTPCGAKLNGSLNWWTSQDDHIRAIITDDDLKYHLCIFRFPRLTGVSTFKTKKLIHKHKTRRKTKGHYTHLPKKAHHRLHLITSNGITYKSQCLASHKLQKLLGIEPWKITLRRFPSPILIVFVRSPIALTVLHLRQKRTRVVRVQRSLRIIEPVTTKQITFCKKTVTNLETEAIIVNQKKCYINKKLVQDNNNTCLY